LSNIIDGRAIAAEVRSEIRQEVDRHVSAGNRPPYLAVVLIGDDPASASYVRGKQRAAAEVGIESETMTFSSDLSEDRVLSIIRELNTDDSVDGILVQLPLPEHIDDQKVIDTIDPDKDVDCFHARNIGRLLLGLPGFKPATPAGIVELLKRTGISTVGKRVVIVGRSNIVGKPLANLLMQKGMDATVTVCHSRTRNLSEITLQADILVAAIGRADFVTADMVKDGAVVIDVGVNRVDDPSRERGYRLTGDVDFSGVSEKVSYITPVPGGVGPMTIALMLRNTLLAAS
jgi:methylenetetrahydrofolate dehydrogenase (NADP+) / methenyltetrahydrofolate cyclohydrolase